jgi:hypothetical protein
LGGRLGVGGQASVARYLFLRESSPLGRLRSALLLEFHLSKLLQLGSKPMPQRAFGPQFVEQTLCFLEASLVKLPAIEQSSPTRVDLLFRKQSKPPWVKNLEVSPDPLPSLATRTNSRHSWLEDNLLHGQIHLSQRGSLPRCTRAEDLILTK